jgi:hypothetical protein
MHPAVARIRRSLVALLAVAFLFGTSLAATHVHAWASGAGAPSASTDQHKGDTADTVCAICFGLHGARGLPPNAPALATSDAVAPAPPFIAGVPARTPFLAFRSRAPPPG